MSSFNQFKNNCWRDSVIVAFINCGTSVFAGFAIFSLLGFMAHQTNQPVDKVAAGGKNCTLIPNSLFLDVIVYRSPVMFVVKLFCSEFHDSEQLHIVNQTYKKTL